MFTLRRADVVIEKVNGKRRAGLFVRSSKTDRTNSGEWLWMGAVTGDAVYCPVRLLGQYLDVSNERWPHGGDAPLFKRACGRNVTRQDLTDALRKHAAVVGLPVERVSVYSLRIGALFEMANAGVPMETIQAVARWSATSAPAMSLLYCRMNMGRRQVANDALFLTGAPESEYLFRPAACKNGTR